MLLLEPNSIKHEQRDYDSINLPNKKIIAVHRRNDIIFDDDRFKKKIPYRNEFDRIETQNTTTTATTRIRRKKNFVIDEISI